MELPNYPKGYQDLNYSQIHGQKTHLPKKTFTQPSSLVSKVSLNTNRRTRATLKHSLFLTRVIAYRDATSLSVTLGPHTHPLRGYDAALGFP